MGLGLAALIGGGISAVDNFLARRDAKNEERRKERRADERRRSASDFARANYMAQRQLQDRLMSDSRGIQEQEFDASSIFADPGNPFAQAGEVLPESQEEREARLRAMGLI